MRFVSPPTMLRRGAFSSFALMLVASACGEGSSPPAKVAPSASQPALRDALQGYDPVAYFAQGEPTQGTEEFSAAFGGVAYHFATQENLDAFSAVPKKYAPQYGGYCAWAMAQGNKAPVNPLNWRIVDDKLYLNFSDEVQSKWEQDIPGFISTADENWAKVAD